MQIEIEGIPIAYEEKLIKKLDVMCDRVTKKHPSLDACLENSGYEGEGKTNASLVEAAYIKKKTGRNINLFFLTSSCLKFAQSTEEQLIILDEPVFESLSTDHASRLSKDFLRLTSTMRKKRHFFIINFAKFWKFPDFLVVDRALGMVHLYSRNGTDPGRFFYIRKKNLESLWNAYKKSGKRLYGKLKSFGGRFPYIMDDMFDKLDITVEGKPHATLNDYQNLKDKAIAAIGNDELKKSKKEIESDRKLNEMRAKFALIVKEFDLPQEKVANLMGISSARIREWRQKAQIQGISLGNRGFEARSPTTIINTMADNQEKIDIPKIDEQTMSNNKHEGVKLPDYNQSKGVTDIE